MLQKKKQQVISEVRMVIRTYFKEERKEKKNTNAQDAHEAIRPTSSLREPSSLKELLSRDQLRLYKLIWETIRGESNVICYYGYNDR